MRLRYRSGTEQKILELGDTPVVIGRATDAQITVQDERVSRRHCEIRPWDGDFVIKDLKAQNGTYLNEERIDVAVLRCGDRIRVGNTLVLFESRTEISDESALRQIEDEMEEGKGYRTILHEIVDNLDQPVPPPSGAAKPKPPSGTAKPPSGTGG